MKEKSGGLLLELMLGVESDGKNDNFERPVLIVKKFNGQMCWSVPLTSKERKGEHYLRVNYDDGISFVCLSQIKTMSSKRLLRKIGMISEKEFNEVVEGIVKYLK
jgi:mRNA interferase MazF